MDYKIVDVATVFKDGTILHQRMVDIEKELDNFIHILNVINKAAYKITNKTIIEKIIID